ncbi:MAG: hypothetical protein F4X74_13200 [Acidimicrobiia bacterium]|nr:hypothetical protein [Acidimicrobiia bacterium]
MNHAKTVKGSVLEESLKAQTAFLSCLVSKRSDTETAATLVLKDRQAAAWTRDHLATHLKRLEDPQILVLDLAGITLTPSSMQELILPLAQRIRGGEYGTVRLVISTADPGVADFLRYMAQVHKLSLYLCRSPFNLREATPIGSLTRTASRTLDAIVMLGGQVTASQLAETEGIRQTAAINRLVNLDREGYLVRQPRGHREGDVYIEPRSATSTPMALSEYF